ncbi:hypothetical protein BC827DRAFT_1156231 [Russula dissimulans]|nr:hypothetical protein BC827DRAFT_1156231 [Russula dissimulans]
MTTRGQIIDQGIMKWGEMEAGWKGPIPHGVSSSSVDTNIEVNASFGHVTDVVAPDAQGLAAMPLHALSNNLRQEKPMSSGMEGDRRTTLIWEHAGQVSVSSRFLQITGFVLLEDLLLSKSASTFPTSLQVGIVEAGTGTRDIQSKIRKRKAPMARVKYALETDHLAFGELIEWLTKAGGVRRKVPRQGSSLSPRQFAVALYDIQDRGHPGRFLLAPLGNELLCTVLPVSDIEELHTRPLDRTMPLVMTAQNQ